MLGPKQRAIDRGRWQTPWDRGNDKNAAHSDSPGAWAGTATRSERVGARGGYRQLLLIGAKFSWQNMPSEAVFA